MHGFMGRFSYCWHSVCTFKKTSVETFILLYISGSYTVLSDFVGEMESCNFLSEQIVKVTQIYLPNCILLENIHAGSPFIRASLPR